MLPSRIRPLGRCSILLFGKTFNWHLDNKGYVMCKLALILCFCWIIHSVYIALQHWWSECQVSPFTETWKMKGTWSNSTNILGLVIFSVVTGFLKIESQYHTYNQKVTWSYGQYHFEHVKVKWRFYSDVLLGIAISISGEEGKPLLLFFRSVSHVMMKVLLKQFYSLQKKRKLI